MTLTTSYVLVLLIANQWSVSPLHFPTKIECEHAYQDISSELKQRWNFDMPEHKCVEETRVSIK